MISPRVSVIVPVHNAEKYLGECLDSILRQTEKSIEVICVDDGSTDGSPSILSDFAARDDRVRLLRQACSGAGAARNAGLAVARGTYLSFLDSDDFFEPQMLEAAANRMEELEADVIVFGSWVYSTERNADRPATWNLRVPYVPRNQPFSCLDVADHAFLAFGNCVWNKLFRRCFILENNLSFQEISRANDLLFSCGSIALAQRICTLNQNFVHYRVSNDNSLQATNDRDPLAFYRAFAALRSLLEANNLLEPLRKGYLNHVIDGILYNADSLKTLSGFLTLKEAVAETIEPQLKLLSQPSDLFEDLSQSDQYRSLCTDSAVDYLFKRTKELKASRENGYWWTDYHCQRADKLDAQLKHREQDLAQSRGQLESDNRKLREANDRLQSTRRQLEAANTRLGKANEELEAIRSSRSFKIGTALTAPARFIKQLVVRARQKIS